MNKKYERLKTLYELYDNASTKLEKKKYLEEIIEIDPSDIDSMHRLIDLLPINEQLEALLDLKEKCWPLVSDAFIEYGDLYSVHATRPYMFILHDLLTRYEKSKDIDKAYSISREIMKYNPGDNLGTRFNLVAYYIGQNKLNELTKFINESPDEFSVALRFASLYLKELKNPTGDFKDLYNEIPYLYALLSREINLTSKEIDKIIDNIKYYKPSSFYESLMFYRLLNIYSNKEIKSYLYRLCAYTRDMPKLSIKDILPKITKEVIYSMYKTYRNEEDILLRRLKDKDIDEDTFKKYKKELNDLNIIEFVERDNINYFYLSEATTSLAKMYLKEDIAEIEYLKNAIFSL